MKKQAIIFLGFIIIFLCMFPLVSFCKNTTEIKLNVYEIKVNCDLNGSFIVDEEKYSSEKSFFVGEKAKIYIITIPKKGYEVDSIKCEPECDYILENDKLEIRNINDNINVKITFKPIEIPVAGLDSEDNEIIKNESKEDKHGKWIFLGIALTSISTITVYFIYKKRSKK